MAKGRIIVNAITMDKRINDLSDDTSRLAFTWLVTFADREGRTHGDPALVRSMLFPRRSDVTVEQMERYIGEWAAVGLVVWYEAEGDRWIHFPAFTKHQAGFDQRHEPESSLPAPPPVRSTPVPDASTIPDVVRTTPVQCTSEVKRSEHEHEHEEKLIAAGTANAPPGKPKPETCPKSYQMAILKTCGINPDTATKDAHIQAARAGKVLIKAGVTEADLQSIRSKWDHFDWRADHPPTITQLRNEWQTIMALTESNAHGPNRGNGRTDQGKRRTQSTTGLDPETERWLDANDPGTMARLRGNNGDAAAGKTAGGGVLERGATRLDPGG